MCDYSSASQLSYGAGTNQSWNLLKIYDSYSNFALRVLGSIYYNSIMPQSHFKKGPAGEKAQVEVGEAFPSAASIFFRLSVVPSHYNVNPL